MEVRLINTEVGDFVLSVKNATVTDLEHILTKIVGYNEFKSVNGRN